MLARIGRQRRGLAAAEILLVLEVLLAIAAAAIWWHQFSIYSPDTRARAFAVLRVQDPQVLRRFATMDPASSVRENATRNLEQASWLVEIARSERDAGVRLAALRKLSQPQHWAGLGLDDRLWVTRKLAAGKVETAALSRIALEDPDEGVRQAALDAVTDPLVLIRVASTARDAETRRLAMTGLTRDLFERAARDNATPGARAALHAAQTLLRLVRKSVPGPHQDRVAAGLLTVAIRLADPMWERRYPADWLESWAIEWKPLRQRYPSGATLAGEEVRLTTTFSRGGPPHPAGRWRSVFPDQPPPGDDFVAARIDLAEFLMLRLSSDPSAFAKVATTDPDPAFRRAAIDRLTDRRALTSIAQSDPDPALREAARRRRAMMP